MAVSSWIYPEFFQATREYILYLQQLSMLLISAIAIVFYNNRNSRSKFFFIVIVLGFITGICTLVAGLYLYSGYLEAILNFDKKPDFSKIRCWINTQFILAIVTTIFMGLSAFAARNGEAKK